MTCQRASALRTDAPQGAKSKVQSTVAPVKAISYSDERRHYRPWLGFSGAWGRPSLSLLCPPAAPTGLGMLQKILGQRTVPAYHGHSVGHLP
jgi:hypothetical protein